MDYLNEKQAERKNIVENFLTNNKQTLIHKYERYKFYRPGLWVMGYWASKVAQLSKKAIYFNRKRFYCFPIA